jgi:flavin reductase (DIM6/NTAB) family NADH-FMN oxidoreductase RutF
MSLKTCAWHVESPDHLWYNSPPDSSASSEGPIMRQQDPADSSTDDTPDGVDTAHSDHGKTDLDPHKSAWRPSLLVDQVVLISSRSSQGEDHAARKSWLTMVREDPPMLGLCCRLSHRTAINILETREFVVNIPGENLAAIVWDAGDSVASAGAGSPWTFVPSRKVGASRVEECVGHIECELDSTKRLGGEEMIFFAKIVAASADTRLLEGPRADRYRDFKPLLYLEEDLFSVPDRSRTIGK